MTASDRRLTGIERQLAALTAAVEDMRKDHVLREVFIAELEARAEARGFERGRGAGRQRPAARAPYGSHLQLVVGGVR